MKHAGFLLLGIVCLCGCGISVPLKPMPVIYGPGKLNLCSMIPEERRTTSVPIYYATDRKSHGPADNCEYGNDIDSSLHFGVSTIKLGDKKTTWNDICKASSGGDSKLEFTLANSSDYPNPAAFCDAINRQLATTPNHEVSIYVHGYYTAFETAVTVLGKMFHCSARRGVMVTFSWPARQNMYLYKEDLKRGLASAHYLADLIELIADHTNAENINLLAYSAGAPCATDALLELRKRHKDETPDQLAKRLRIGNVIYAASDLDLDTFGRKQLVELKQLAQYVIVYISHEDLVLGAAAMLGGGSRLGNPDVKEFTKEEQEAAAKDPQIQIIDVSDVPGPQGFGGVAGHYYWYANDWVMTDVVVAFRWQLSPDQRGLYRKPGMARWNFPKDYPQKVTNAVKGLLPPTTMPSNPSTRP